MFPYILILATMLAALAEDLPAQDSGASESTDAAWWLDQVKQALGGSEKLNGLASLAVEAECSGPEGPFTTRVESLRPNWVHFRQEEAGRAMAIWSTPDQTWTFDADDNPAFHPEGVRSFVRAHEFHLVIIELADRFSRFSVDDETVVDGQTCRQLRMQDSDGRPAMICISPTSHLPIVLETNPEGAQGPVRTHFSDWEDFAGIRLFRSFDLHEGADRHFRYDYQDIQPGAVSALQFVEPLPEQREDQQALLNILDQDRQAHLQSDARLLTANLADNILDLSSGAIRAGSSAELAEFFARMFDGAEYARWDDLRPPLMKISPDGTLAWVARQVAVDVSSKNASGEPVRTRFVSAYSSTYEKNTGRWEMTSVTSTFAPENGG